MHRLVERYVWEVEKRCRRSLGGGAAEEISREIRVHLAASILEGVGSGLTEDEAAKAACKKMGNEGLLAESFVREHSESAIWVQRIKLPLIFALIGATGILLPLDYHKTDIVLGASLMMFLAFFVTSLRQRSWLWLPMALCGALCLYLAMPLSRIVSEHQDQAYQARLSNEAMRRSTWVRSLDTDNPPVMNIEGKSTFIGLKTTETYAVWRRPFMPYRARGPIGTTVIEAPFQSRSEASRSWKALTTSYLRQLERVTDTPLWFDAVRQDRLAAANFVAPNLLSGILMLSALAVLNALALGIGTLRDRLLASRVIAT